MDCPTLPVATVCVADGHTYIWIYPPCKRTAVLRDLGRYASRPDVPFSWHDAAAVSRQIREDVREEAKGVGDE